MAYASANQGGGECTPEIRVRFQASIRENAGLDAPIPCSASVSYLNSAGVFYEAQSGAGEVHTGGIHLFVSDEAGQPLSGAAFRLVRAEDEWNEEETESSTAYVNFLTGSGGKPVSEVTTGEDGRAFLWGVAYGRYYLVQTKAPDGKDKLSQPAAVIVSASSHLTVQDGWQDARGMTVDNTVNLVNSGRNPSEDGGRERGGVRRSGEYPDRGDLCADSGTHFPNSKKKNQTVIHPRHEK